MSRDLRKIATSVKRAQRQHATGTLKALYPGLPDDQAARAAERETQRASAFTTNMQQRLDAQAPDLSGVRGPARRDMLASIAAREQRYTAQHLQAQSKRMAHEKSVGDLRQAGERFGFWQTSPDVAKHCDGCLKMGGKFWPLSVLASVNPSTSHPGCQCKILGMSDAKTRGLRLVRGQVTKAVRERAGMGHMSEAALLHPTLLFTAADPALDAAIREAAAHYPEVAGVVARALREALIPHWREDEHPRWPAGHPLAGRWMSKDVSVPEVPELAAWRQAVAAGDPHEREVFSHLITALKASTAPGERDKVMRAAYAARAVSRNPSDRRASTNVDYGTGGQGVPIAPLEPGGRTHGWTAAGGYEWTLPPERAQVTQALGKAGLGVSGATVFTSVAVRARAAEIAFPALRRHRTTGGHQVNDSTPLDATERLPGPQAAQLRQSAHTLTDQITSRLHDAGLVDGEPVPLGPDAPVDMRIGDTAVVIVPEPLRGLTPDAHQQPAASRATPQLREARERYITTSKLHTLVVRAIMDPDNNRAFVFAEEPEPHTGEAFAPRRFPQELVRALFRGEARPGDEWATKFGRKTTMLGTFKPGLNPLLDHPGATPRPAAAADDGMRRTRDVSEYVPAAERPAPVDRAAQRAERIDTLMRMRGEGRTQAQVAHALGIKQPAVSKLIAAARKQWQAEGLTDAQINARLGG